MASVFEARFGGGRCPECGDEIKKNDEVSYSGQDLLHAECNSTSQYKDYQSTEGWYQDSSE